MTTAPSLIAIADRHTAGSPSRIETARATTLVLGQVTPFDTTPRHHRGRSMRSRRPICALGSCLISAPDQTRDGRRALKSP